MTGCGDDPAIDAAGAIEYREEAGDPGSSKGTVLSKDELPVVKAIDAAEVFVQKLPQATAAGENVAVHMRLPPPADAKLSASLVRVLGDPKNPLVLFRSDTLVALGKLKKSPGEQFFTTFARLGSKEPARRAAIEASLGKSATAEAQRLVFHGRAPIAITTGIKFDLDIFDSGDPVALGPCPVQPLSEQARWDEALLITDLAVVQDPARTNDVCDPGADNPDGVWTFKHLMTEMATGSGLSTHDFVVQWLSAWLTDVVVNGDTIGARTTMYDRVIKPWAIASGIGSSFVGGELSLDGELDLDRAPFHLSAIVNRIDLGATTTSGGGYGGGSTSKPTTAGELRFVFGVQNLDGCQNMPFTVIFEYGVPISGCSNVREWAIDWTELSDPALERFSDPWRQHLEDLSESVVVAGAAPGRGNDSAINQVRTNEVALNLQWQLREFTLTTEDPLTDVETPADGPLRPHTVALTPDDSNYDSDSDWRIAGFVLYDSILGETGRVRASVPATVGSFMTSEGPVLTDCSASYEMPLQFNEESFRGGDALAAFSSPFFWAVDGADPSDLADVCAREQFSLNTCNGCHLRDTATDFLHVNPVAMPAQLSAFLTGGGGVLSVPDQQFGEGVASMLFSDLDRRHNRLYEIACAECGSIVGVSSGVLERIAEIAGVVPVETGGIKPWFPVGPIVDLGAVKQIFAATEKLKDPKNGTDRELGKLVRRREGFVH